MALVALESCAGEAAACAGADASAGDEVMACDDGVALGCEGVAATVAESDVDGAGAGSLVTLRSLVEAVALRSLRVDAAALLVERDDWLEALALEGLALGATSTQAVKAIPPVGRPGPGEGPRDTFRALEKGLMEIEFSGKVYIKQGTIYSYSGNLTFWVKDKRPGARPSLVIVTGTGRLILTEPERDLTFMQVAEDPVFVEPAHLLACEEALRIIDGWSDGGAPSVDVPPRSAVGHGATEAPRGVLYHRYELSPDGTVLDARIVPPTSQNQASIENDLRVFVQDRLALDTDELTRQCEQAIRNYDPCISCATHFLRLTVEEE